MAEVIFHWVIWVKLLKHSISHNIVRKSRIGLMFCRKVCVAIISVPNVQISFKVWLLVPLDYMQRQFFYFVKKNFFHFLQIFFFFVNMEPYGSEYFKKLLLLQITAKSLGFSFQWASQKYCFGFFKLWVFHFSLFWLTWDPMGAKSSKPYPSVKSL